LQSNHVSLIPQRDAMHFSFTATSNPWSKELLWTTSFLHWAIQIFCSAKEHGQGFGFLSPLNAKLNPICHLLELLGAHNIFHVSRINYRARKRQSLHRISKYKVYLKPNSQGPIWILSFSCLPRSLFSWHPPKKRIFKRHSCLLHGLSSSSSFTHSQGTQDDGSPADFPLYGTNTITMQAWLHCVSLTLCFSNVSAVMNLHVPWNAGNFLTSCKTVSFSRRTLHHGVSKCTVRSVEINL